MPMESLRKARCRKATKSREDDDIPVFQLVAQYKGQDFQSVVTANPTSYFWARNQEFMATPQRIADVGSAEARKIASWNLQVRHDLLPFARWVEEHYQIDMTNQMLINPKTRQKHSARPPL